MTVIYSFSRSWNATGQ